jgi:hypothetical protein
VTLAWTDGGWGLVALGAFSVLGTLAFLALLTWDIERMLRNLDLSD